MTDDEVSKLWANEIHYCFCMTDLRAKTEELMGRGLDSFQWARVLGWLRIRYRQLVKNGCLRDTGLEATLVEEWDKRQHTHTQQTILEEP